VELDPRVEQRGQSAEDIDRALFIGRAAAHRGGFRALETTRGMLPPIFISSRVCQKGKVTSTGMLWIGGTTWKSPHNVPVP
jgi:hypothetical protein